MGLIKKKTAVRTTEGGIKYICDICSVDITATVCLPAGLSSRDELWDHKLTFLGPDKMRRRRLR